MNRVVPRRLRRSAGFTMIEVMVAMLLTAIATSGIIGLYVVQTRASGYSRHTTEATILAQDQLEQLRTSSIMGAPPAVASLNEHGQVVPGGLFTRSFTVVAGPPGANPTLSPDYDDITVVVAWDEDGAAKNVTLISRRNR